MVDTVRQRRALRAAPLDPSLEVPVEFAVPWLPWDSPQRFADRVIPGSGTPRTGSIIARGVPGSVTPVIAPGLGGDTFTLPKPAAKPIAHEAVAVIDKSKFPVLNELTVVVPTADLLFLPAPTDFRVMLMMRNSSALANIYISFGRNASTESVIRLTPNTVVLWDVNVPQNDVHAIADAAAGQLAYAYSEMVLP